MVEDSETRATAGRRRALGRAVRRYRGGVTQGELAALLGVSQASVSSWELGGVPLTCEQVASVERRLGLAMGTLLVEAGYVAESLLGGGAALVALGDLRSALSRLEAQVNGDSTSPR